MIIITMACKQIALTSYCYAMNKQLQNTNAYTVTYVTIKWLKSGYRQSVKLQHSWHYKGLINH